MSDLAGRIFELIWMAHAQKDGLGLPATVVPLPLGQGEEEFQIPLPMPLPERRVAQGGRQ